MAPPLRPTAMTIEPFTINIPDTAIEDLKRRLDCTRWPDAPDGSGWELGSNLEYMQSLCAYWRDSFDWRAQEAVLNRLPQYRIAIDGFRIHFVHVRGKGPAPLPLVVTHGWPGSFVEMTRLVALLTDPASHGGAPEDAFDVVVPSLPGYGFSDRPHAAGMDPRQIAILWQRLMSTLGYERFAAQGGDWGASVTTCLGFLFPERLAGLHLNYMPGSYRPPLSETESPLSGEEQDFLDRLAAWADSEGAYGHIQGTKPQSLAYALNDSPAGLAAWIVEKFRAWSDCEGRIENALTRDELLTNISIYWFTRTIGSSMRLYWETRRRPLHFAAGERVRPPVAVAHFPKELPMPPRRFVERVYNLQRWSTMPKGGHFAALEQPELLAQDITSFLRPYRR